MPSNAHHGAHRLCVLGKINRLAEHQLRVQMLQGDGGPGKALDQGALDGAQPIGATEITFDIGDKTIECLGRASAALELTARKQLRLGCRASTSRALRCKPRLDATRTMALTALVRPSRSRHVSNCGWVDLCERRRAGFARPSGWQPVGNWVASAGEFSSIPVTRSRHPDNEQKNRDAKFASKNGPKLNPSVTP